MAANFDDIHAYRRDGPAIRVSKMTKQEKEFFITARAVK
jgi:hypothetical protein